MIGRELFIGEGGHNPGHCCGIAKTHAIQHAAPQHAGFAAGSGAAQQHLGATPKQQGGGAGDAAARGPAERAHFNRGRPAPFERAEEERMEALRDGGLDFPR